MIIAVIIITCRNLWVIKAKAEMAMTEQLKISLAEHQAIEAAARNEAKQVKELQSMQTSSMRLMENR